LFGILLLALLAHARWRGRREDRAGPRPLPHDRGAYGLLPLWVLLGVYWLAAVCAHLNV